MCCLNFSPSPLNQSLELLTLPICLVTSARGLHPVVIIIQSNLHKGLLNVKWGSEFQNKLCSLAEELFVVGIFFLSCLVSSSLFLVVSLTFSVPIQNLGGIGRSAGISLSVHSRVNSPCAHCSETAGMAEACLHPRPKWK